MSQILVVSHDRLALAHTLDVLNGAGYLASGVSAFQDAVQWLAQESPDLVIADERLGAFNGLHVIIKARTQDPQVKAIVTTPVKSRGLEVDARHLDVQCMITPKTKAQWLAAVSKSLRIDPMIATTLAACGRDMANESAAIAQSA